MAKLTKYLICYCFLIFTLSFPVYSQNTLEGGVELDWPLLNQEAREKTINYYRDILFKDVTYKVDKEQVKSQKKDFNVWENREALKKEIRKLSDRELAGFYLLNKLLILYGVKYYEDKYHIYYYNATGGLEYFDILDKPHDEYPHIAYQYRKNGKLVGSSYYISEYDQYIFDEKGKFKGRWYEDRLYDKKAKLIMTRKLP